MPELKDLSMEEFYSRYDFMQIRVGFHEVETKVKEYSPFGWMKFYVVTDEDDWTEKTLHLWRSKLQPRYSEVAALEREIRDLQSKKENTSKLFGGKKRDELDRLIQTKMDQVISINDAVQREIKAKIMRSSDTDTKPNRN